ncbi:MAG: antibiotic biosynthesis monooxygenase [candidate division FCPU426 bacterium]
MIVTCITIFVQPDRIEDFIQATLENHRASRSEAGNLRFDVLQCASDPSRFFLYEAYRSEADAAAHKQTPHYNKWKETVAGWMAKPREGVPHRPLAPEDPEQW